MGHNEDKLMACIPRAKYSEMVSLSHRLKSRGMDERR